METRSKAAEDAKTTSPEGEQEARNRRGEKYHTTSASRGAMKVVGGSDSKGITGSRQTYWSPERGGDAGLSRGGGVRGHDGTSPPGRGAGSQREEKRRRKAPRKMAQAYKGLDRTAGGEKT